MPAVSYAALTMDLAVADATTATVRIAGAMTGSSSIMTITITIASKETPNETLNKTNGCGFTMQ